MSIPRFGCPYSRPTSISISTQTQTDRQAHTHTEDTHSDKRPFSGVYPEQKHHDET